MEDKGVGSMHLVCVCFKNHNNEKKKGSNRFSSTEINWGLATHLEYRALSSGLHTYPHVHWSVTPSWWNHIGWRLCQVNNTAWSLMLNFLEVPTRLSTSYLLTAPAAAWLHSGLNGDQGVYHSFAPACRSFWNTSLEESRGEDKP